MVKLEFLEQIKKQVDRIGMMRKNIAARICHRLEGPTYSTKEQQRRRKIMFYVGGSVALALTGGITYTILNKNITITLEKGDNPRRRIRNIYDKYGLDEQMRSIYTSESYTSYENTEKRFRIFFSHVPVIFFIFKKKMSTK